jgi:acyl-CoA thioesterase YciA
MSDAFLCNSIRTPIGRFSGALSSVRADDLAAMDAAVFMTATARAKGRVVTAAVSNIAFVQPVYIGDAVCCYTDVERIGRTSITLYVEVWVLRQGQGHRVKVTDAEFVFVAVDENGRPRAVSHE